LLSKIELEFLKSPESFDTDYRRVLRHRVNSKVQELHKEIEILQKCGFSVTENWNGQQNQQAQKMAKLSAQSSQSSLSCILNVRL